MLPISFSYPGTASHSLFLIIPLIDRPFPLINTRTLSLRQSPSPNLFRVPRPLVFRQTYLTANSVHVRTHHHCFGRKFSPIFDPGSQHPSSPPTIPRTFGPLAQRHRPSPVNYHVSYSPRISYPHITTDPLFSIVTTHTPPSLYAPRLRW